MEYSVHRKKSGLHFLSLTEVFCRMRDGHWALWKIWNRPVRTYGLATNL